MINRGSTLTNSGSGFLGTFGSQSVLVFRGIGYLGLISDSTGTATAMGAGSSGSNNEGLFVGIGGIGSLTVLGGARVTSRFGVR